MIRSGARYLGIVKRLVEMSVEHARDWISLGAALAARPAVQRMLAEMGAGLESARWLVYHAAWLVDRGDDVAARRAAAEVRLITGELLKSSVAKATMIFNGPGPTAVDKTTTHMDSNRVMQWLWSEHPLVSPQTLELGLQHARSVLAGELLNLYQTGASAG
jgi:alkylation response protein AidB-like acyl-CoA dehydrogenase